MSQFQRGRSLRRGLMAVLLAGTTMGGLAAAQADTPDANVANPKPGAIQPSALPQTLPDFVELVKQVKPAVVSITSKLPEDTSQNDLQQMLPFPFPFAMPQGRTQRRVIEARGSGFIIDADGTVVTNNHVVKDAKAVSVTLDDGTTLPAKVIGRDSKTDVAVLRVKANHKLPFINLGDSSAVQPGQWVIAVGNPFGLGGTVTAGIVSARGRDIGEGPYDSFLQIDAPINQGNSGGPLFTQDGKVVGVNSAILSPSGGSIGIGFAIPSNLVKSVVTQLEKSGRVTRGYLGVEAQSVNAAMAGALRLPKPGGDSQDHGALVASVEPEGPASKAEIQPGDVIVSVNGKTITSPRDLAVTIADLVPGSTGSIGVIRNGAPRTISATIGTLPGDTLAANGGQGEGFGLQLGPLTADARQQLGVSNSTHGAVVTGVAQGSPAEDAGLRPGDVLVGVGDRSVGTPAEANSALRAAGSKGDQPVALRILRDGQLAFVAVTPANPGSGDQDGG